jgi:hypothetical protein
MDMDPEDGVGLALESLRRAGRDAEPGKVMEELFALLRENRSPLTVSGAGSAPLPSVPAMNRRTVLPNAMEPLSLTAAIAKLFRALSGRLLKKHGARDHG